MGDVRKIYCPKCGRKAMTHDGKSEISKAVKCQRCKKLVLFNPMTNEVKNIPVPERTCASGKRYY